MFPLESPGYSLPAAAGGIYQKLIVSARKYTAFRENSHFYLTKSMPVFKTLFLAIGGKLVEKGLLAEKEEVMYFTYWELKQLVYEIYSQKKISRLELKETIDTRKKKLDKRKKNWSSRTLKIDLPDAPVLQGVGASKGKVSGVCRLVTNLEDLWLLKPGEILVAQSTNPSWTPVFCFIGGLVVEYGGALSHAAIVAREYGIPAVMGIPGATAILKDGDMIIIDGSTGTIYRTEPN